MISVLQAAAKPAPVPLDLLMLVANIRFYLVRRAAHVPISLPTFTAAMNMIAYLITTSEVAIDVKASNSVISDSQYVVGVLNFKHLDLRINQGIMLWP